MADIVHFDGSRYRCRAKTANRYHPANKAEIHRVVGCWYGGMTATAISRREGIPLNAVERMVRQNSRPIDVEPLAIDRRLRRAA